MAQRIIYMEDGALCVITPSDDCLQEHTVQEIAAKDVPKGCAYKIIDESAVPTDRTFRGAWEVNESELNDGVGDEHNLFVTDPQHPSYVDPEGEE